MTIPGSSAAGGAVRRRGTCANTGLDDADRRGARRGVVLTLDRDAGDDTIRAVVRAVAPSGVAPDAVFEPFILQRAAQRSPASRGTSIAVPQLGMSAHGAFDLVFPETLVEMGGWNLSAVPTDLPGFAVTETPDAVAFDVDGGKVVWNRIEAQLEWRSTRCGL